MERVTGIEPAWPAWKAGALPLSYTREWCWPVNWLRDTGKSTASVTESKKLL